MYVAMLEKIWIARKKKGEKRFLYCIWLFFRRSTLQYMFVYFSNKLKRQIRRHWNGVLYHSHWIENAVITTVQRNKNCSADVCSLAFERESWITVKSLRVPFSWWTFDGTYCSNNCNLSFITVGLKGHEW